MNFENYVLRDTPHPFLHQYQWYWTEVLIPHLKDLLWPTWLLLHEIFIFEKGKDGGHNVT